jgi:non-heme chloroperoxidase
MESRGNMERRSFLHKIVGGAAALAQMPRLRAATTEEYPSQKSNVEGTGPYVIVGPTARLFYKDWCAPASLLNPKTRTVLFLHTWALNSDIWQYQMNYLCGRGMRTVAYDRRGEGKSNDPGCNYDFDALAGDLAKIIEQLDLRDIILVGHSMGCGEIVRYLSKYGDARVSRIVFVATSLPFGLKTDDNPDGVPNSELVAVRDVITHDFPQYLRSLAPDFFGRRVSSSTEDWVIRMSVDHSSLPALVGTQIADTETDFRKELPSIAKPTLIIHGDSDVFCRLEVTAQRVHRLIPGSRLKVYEGGPHGLMISHMDELNRDLFDFISMS